MGCGASTSSPRAGTFESPPSKAIAPKGGGATQMSEKDAAAAKLQARARGRAVREHLDEETRSATLVQAMFRGNRDRRYSAQLMSSRQEEVLETHDAALKKSKSGSSLQQVNDYSIVKQLGKGAYGVVYEATYKPGGGDGSLLGKASSVVSKASSVVSDAAQSVLGMKGGHQGDDGSVAIKVLSRSILKRKRVGRFGSAYDSVLGEIAIMKKLLHPNIVRLYEVIDDPEEDLLFMVMEFVRGGDLAGPVEAKRVVPEDQLRVWMRDLVLGLEHLHNCGVCHRDIKPENVLWDPVSERAKLSDFGISGFFRASRLGGDFFNATGGSLPFFAPEMCRTLKGAGYSGRAADIWAVGCCLYMWMYHECPYVADNPPKLLQMIADDSIDYPDDKCHSERLMALLHALLAKAPRERITIKGLRKDAFLTHDQAEPLPAPQGTDKSIVRDEFSNAIQRVAVMSRAAADAPSNAPTYP